MSDSKYTLILLREDPAIVQQLDERAAREGTDRTKLIRRAIRLLLLSSVPTDGDFRDAEEAAQAA